MTPESSTGSESEYRPYYSCSLSLQNTRMPMPRESRSPFTRHYPTCPLDPTFKVKGCRITTQRYFPMTSPSDRRESTGDTPCERASRCVLARLASFCHVLRGRCRTTICTIVGGSRPVGKNRISLLLRLHGLEPRRSTKEPQSTDPSR